MKTKTVLPILALIIGFISCDRATETEKAAADQTVVALDTTLTHKNDKEQDIPVVNVQPTTTDSSVRSMPLVTVNPDWEKKIIKTGTLKFEVKDFKKSSETVHNTVKRLGGYIASEDQSLSDERSESSITIKVPVQQFEDMMNDLSAADVKVMERKISTNDVTDEVVDTKSRLETKKEMRLKYLEFLKQSKNMQEVLQAQNEVNNVQEQIESAAGRVNYLSHQSMLSTINLSFYQPTAGYDPTSSSPSFFARLGASLKSGSAWLANLLVSLASIWPFFLILILSYVGWRRFRSPKVIQEKI